MRRLASYALFEGRPHTTKGQWFNPIVFSLLQSLKAAPGTPNLKAPIFITGLGRSGTTILGLLLSLHRDVGFLNEPKAIWSLVNPASDVCGDYVLTNGKFQLTANDASPEQIKIAHRIFARYLAAIGSIRLVDKYPEFIFRIDYLLKIFPDARIIFISRNGPDAVASIDLWSKRLGTENRGQVEDWWGRNDVKWNYLRKEFLEHNESYSELSSLATAELDHRNRAAIEWIITMREGLAQAKAYPGQVYHLAYENLVSDPENQINKLLDHCKLTPDQDVVSYALSSLYVKDRSAWPNLLEPVDTLFTATTNELEKAILDLK